MRVIRLNRYFLCFCVPGVLWLTTQAAEWAFLRYGCASHGKEIARCYAQGIEITPFLGLGLFWCRLLMPVAVIVALAGILTFALADLAVAWKRRREG